MGKGFVYSCGMTAGGRQLSKAVRPIAQREIPAYAGMTESPTCCGPGAIRAAKVNGKWASIPLICMA